MSDDLSGLDMAMASLRADGSDLKILVNTLASQLPDALGSRVVVDRGGGLFRKGGEVKSIRVTVGDDEFEAAVNAGQVECAVSHSSGGIRIRRERVDGPTWVQRLMGSLRQEAQRSDSVRRALESIVFGGTA